MRGQRRDAEAGALDEARARRAAARPARPARSRTRPRCRAASATGPRRPRPARRSGSRPTPSPTASITPGAVEPRHHQRVLDHLAARAPAPLDVDRIDARGRRAAPGPRRSPASASRARRAAGPRPPRRCARTRLPACLSSGAQIALRSPAPRHDTRRAAVEQDRQSSRDGQRAGRGGPGRRASAAARRRPRPSRDSTSQPSAARRPSSASSVPPRIPPTTPITRLITTP